VLCCVCCCCYRYRYLPLPTASASTAANYYCLTGWLASKLPIQPSSSTQQQRSLLHALDLALEPASFSSPAKYLAHLTVISPSPCMKASLTLSVFATNSSISIDCRCRHPVAVLSCLYSCLSCLVQSQSCTYRPSAARSTTRRLLPCLHDKPLANTIQTRRHQHDHHSPPRALLLANLPSIHLCPA
jgi:hypothetical protein